MNEPQRVLFDTNIVSLFQRGDALIRSKVLAVPENVRAAAIITVEEQVTGWYTEIRRAKTDTAVIYAYGRLKETIEFYNNLYILPYDAAALETYRRLAALKWNIAKPDLRIAAIAIAHDALLVTRNRQDFERIPGLTVESWENATA